MAEPEKTRTFIDAGILASKMADVATLVTVGANLRARKAGHDVYITALDLRSGDYTALLTDAKPTPDALVFIGIPGQGRSPIVQFMYERK